MRGNTTFPKDDLRSFDPKFRPPRFAEYLRAVDDLKTWARKRGKDVLHLAVRWALDQPNVSVALWGARRPEQLVEVEDVMGWHLTRDDCVAVDGIVQNAVRDPVGPEFMAPRA
jgi:aryl-alcohol dehydrogenase-like predicted oxidoreductase